jgi:AraC family transcriptional regulator of adaptative response / DNA-3-methyladenine glycosylase II
VQYFRSAAEAAQAGYRPCLRCRPESAPGSPAWVGSATTVRRALGLIEAGALNNGSVAELALRLGVGERYLRKLFRRELGLSPSAVAQHQRLLFARKLLSDTALPVTEVALAAGYGSIRRFNSAFRDALHSTPSDIRRRQARRAAAPVTLHLHYRPPYDWAGILGFFARHAVDGVEWANTDGYQRRIRWQGKPGYFRVSHAPDERAVRVELSLPDNRALMPVLAGIRRMFDLDANPRAIADTLSADRQLAPLLARYPGIRAPMHWSRFEAAVRAVVGQQISTSAARGVLTRLIEALDDGENAGFPEPAALLRLADEQLPMPGRRRQTLRALCECFARNPAVATADLGAIRGIGPWTTAMIALRGDGDPDALPFGDLGLTGACPALTERAAAWQPWRGYAANLLWRSLTP